MKMISIPTVTAASFCILINGCFVKAAFGNNNAGIRRIPDTTSTKHAMNTSAETESATSATLIPGEIDEDVAYASSSFPISPDELIARAKDVLSIGGIGTKDDGACLASDFVFCAAVVGPLPKDEYLEALGSFKLEDSFDIQQNYFGFNVDPMQTNRVWFFTRQVARQIATFVGASPDDRDDLVLPPQLMHLDFDEKGLVREFGFYTVDRMQG